MLNVYPGKTDDRASGSARRKLRIGFVDPLDWNYHALSVLEQPMGGSQSAVCYLAQALAARGHDVSLFTETTQPGMHGGVRCVSLNQPVVLRDFRLDVCVCMLAADLGGQLRPALGDRCKLILWNQHAHDQPAVQKLSETRTRETYDAFAMVSQWQANGFQQAFGIDSGRIGILRNAAAPAFVGLFSEGEAILPAKQWPPVLAYTSTPFRGLDVLLDIFPRIREAVPGTRLEVYSSMRVYQKSAQVDEKDFGELYERCRRTEGVTYVGSVLQPQLAAALRRVTILSYPNTFAETSCISVLEAMASGCAVVTSNLGALPETTAGFGQLVPIGSAGRAAYIEKFVESVVESLGDFQRRPEEMERFLRQQVSYIRAMGTWACRAEEWERWLGAMVA